MGAGLVGAGLVGAGSATSTAAEGVRRPAARCFPVAAADNFFAGCSASAFFATGLGARALAEADGAAEAADPVDFEGGTFFARAGEDDRDEASATAFGAIGVSDFAARVRRPAAGMSIDAAIAGSTATLSVRFAVRLAGFSGAASPSGSAVPMPGIARSTLLLLGTKLSTTSVTDSPTFMNSRALRGAGSAINRSGT